ncbi:MAG TPA: RNA methyltransferase [Fontimonas sp.]
MTSDLPPDPVADAVPTEADPLLRIRIVLVATQHPGNIGSAARAMLTMGLRDLVLVSPDRYPHPQARATATHAGEVLDAARVVDTLEEAIADCGWVVALSARQRTLGDEPLRPAQSAARALGLAAGGATVAFVFGCERTGLTNQQIELCHATTLIPTNPKFSSLNLSQAVQIIAYELRRGAVPDDVEHATKKQHPWYAPPAAADMERYFEHLERILLSTGFIDPANPRKLMRRLRTFYNRAAPDRNELNILRGILTSFEKPKNRRTPLDPGD